MSLLWRLGGLLEGSRGVLRELARLLERVEILWGVFLEAAGGILD